MNIIKKVAKKYYRLDRIKKEHAQYNILLGERANGKSYAVKEEVIKQGWLTDNSFIYMRRYMSDCRANDVISYFADMPIEGITQGEYSLIDCFRGNIYLANMDEDMHIVRGKQIGRTVWLNGLEHFKSQAFPNVTNVIFEEFVTNKGYIDNEPSDLQNFISTIARDRDITVWMIGNKVSRVCPYYGEWSLSNIPRQKPGTIDIYTFERYDAPSDTRIETRVAVELCENAGSQSSMFFGKVAESITGGEWETKEYPHFPREYADEFEEIPVKYEKIYEVLLEDMGFRFVLQLMINPINGGQFIFVYPYTKNRRILRKITNTFSTDPLTTTRLSDKIKAEIKMKELISLDKICYSDNLTGSDFEQVLLNRKGVL